MGSHVCGHAHGNAGCAVEEQQRSLGGENGGLLKGVVKVQGHVHGVLVHVPEHVFGHFLKLGLRVTHGCGRVTVYGAEVSLALHKGVTLVPVLAQTHHCIIYAGVSVRVILTHDLTHDTGTLLGLAAEAQAHVVHAEQNAALNGFETVTGVRKGTGYNYGHGVVYVCGAHLMVYLHLLYIACSIYLLQLILVLNFVHIFSLNLYLCYKHTNIGKNVGKT